MEDFLEFPGFVVIELSLDFSFLYLWNFGVRLSRRGLLVLLGSGSHTISHILNKDYIIFK